MNCLSKSQWARTACGAAMLCLASTAVAADAEHPDVNWITDSNGCRIWNPNPKENETVSWSGACRNGVVQWFRDNQQIARYEGELRGGIQNGSGVLTRGDHRYSGEFRDGKAHGVGHFTGQGQDFTGIWKDGCFRDGSTVIVIGTNATQC